jgi:hypothetical protein
MKKIVVDDHWPDGSVVFDITSILKNLLILGIFLKQKIEILKK